jgi:hypothetical protein
MAVNTRPLQHAGNSYATVRLTRQARIEEKLGEVFSMQSTEATQGVRWSEVGWLVSD